MARSLLLAALLALSACTGAAYAPAAAPAARDHAGRFVEVEAITAEGLPDQRLTIWLPPGYDASQRRYPVLYMHDGHNLFDPAKSNFNKVWAADKAILGLIEEGRIEPHIVVGIWAPGPDRYRQYLPQFLEQVDDPDLAARIARHLNGGAVVSERYLEWITDELKPRIDREYRTRTGAKNTAIAGSSMGGLISCYAILERPDIFGRAACVSSHWPIVLPDPQGPQEEKVKRLWRGWFMANLGDPAGRRIWMDHGDSTLDAYYAPYQQAIDEAFVEAGWQKGSDWQSRAYEKAEHEENAWARRLPEVLGWLLKKD